MKAKIKSMRLEDVLRSRIFWLVILPIVVYLAFLIITFADKGIDPRIISSGGLLFYPFFLFVAFFIGYLTFPLNVLVGLGMRDLNFLDNNLVYIGLPLTYFIVYVIFVIRIKKMSKKTLYLLGTFILLLVLLGLKGCIELGFSTR